MGVLLVLLALAVASIGTELDEARIERDELSTEAEDLRQELDSLSEERNRLKEQVDEQVKAIEQWKVQQERARVGGQPEDIAPSAAVPVPASGSTTP